MKAQHRAFFLLIVIIGISTNGALLYRAIQESDTIQIVLSSIGVLALAVGAVYVVRAEKRQDSDPNT